MAFAPHFIKEIPPWRARILSSCPRGPSCHEVLRRGEEFSVVTRATTCTLVLFFRSFLVSYSFLFLSFSSLPCHFLTFSFFLSLSCERVRSTELFSLRIFLADTRKTVTLLVNRSTERRISTRTTRVTRVSFPPKSLRQSLPLSLFCILVLIILFCLSYSRCNHGTCA